MGNAQQTIPVPNPTTEYLKYWRWTNRRGEKLFVSELLPPDETTAIVFWFHGLGTYSTHTDHRRVTTNLANAGFHVFCYDQSGFGRSVSEENRGYIGNWRWWIDDAIAFIRFITSQYDKSFFISGVSLGGAIALQTSLELPPELQIRFLGAVLLCPLIEQSLELSWIKVKLLETIHALGGDHWRCGPIPYSNLSPESHTAFINDPLCCSGRMKVGMAYQCRELMRAINVAAVTFPFIVFHGVNDTVTPYSGSCRLMDESITLIADKTISTVNTDHNLLDGDVIEERIISQMILWMSKL